MWKRRPETGVAFLRKREVRSYPDRAMPGDRFRTNNFGLCRLSLVWSGPPAILQISKQRSIACAALRGSASRLFSEQKLGYEPEPLEERRGSWISDIQIGRTLAHAVRSKNVSLSCRPPSFVWICGAP